MILVPETVVPPEEIPRYDTAYVAALTEESESTVRRRCAAGQYPHSRFGRALRFSAEDCRHILAMGRQPSNVTPLYDALGGDVIAAAQ